MKLNTDMRFCSGCKLFFFFFNRRVTLEKLSAQSREELFKPYGDGAFILVLECGG